MTFRTCLVLLGSLLACASVDPRAASAQPCPISEMQFRDQGIFTSDASAFDSTHSVFLTFRVAYDLVEGSLFVYHCCSLGVTSVETGDAYDVSGVPPGTPVGLTAELVVDGEIWDSGSCGGSGCAGTLGYAIEHGTEVAERNFIVTLFHGDRAEVHDTISLPVTIVAGQPEEMRFRLRGTRSPGGSHGATGTGRIRFTGLSPGIAITSCHGYEGGPTPAQAASWGAIKAHYR